MNPQSIPDQWYQRPFRAMGCRMSVWLDMEDSKTADRLLREAEDMFHAAERVLSRFDSTSELSRLNNRSGHWTLVSDLLWSVLTQALFMARETDGLFDPTQLAALETAGYDRSFTEMSPDQNMPDDIMIVDRWNQWQQVKLDRSAQAVWLPPGIRLDFGGIAKGHTAQRVVDFLSAEGPCLVDASGDLTAGEAPVIGRAGPLLSTHPFRKPARRTMSCSRSGW
ncbi:MAG: FAD:protein FMN transferase [Chloroflexota bacterium]